MTSPKYSGITRFTGNSGLPADVVGFNGSGASAGFPQPGIILTTFSDEATGSTGWNAAFSYVAATPIVADGQAMKSPEQVDFEKRKARLIAAIDRMKTSAPNWSADRLVVNETSAVSAEKFLKCLPGDARLPKVAPDGEGDVMFVWDDAHNACVVTVEQRTLHVVSKPGTPDVKQIDAQKFLGVRIPPAVLECIPSK
jgi:hypothetical protein